MRILRSIAGSGTNSNSVVTGQQRPRLEDVVSHYRDPLLSAAFELQSRIYNFVHRGFAGYLRGGDEDERVMQ